MNFLSKINFKKLLYIVLVLNSTFLVNLKSDIQSKVVNFSVGQDMTADETFTGAEAINLSVGETLRGSGNFRAPVIDITAKKFEFTGTIHCDNVCNITTQEPFNEKMFKRSGKGKFIIKADPNLDLNGSNKDFSNLLSPVAMPTSKPYIPNIPKIDPYVSKEFDFNGSTFTFNGQGNIDIASAIETGSLEEVNMLLEKNQDIKNNKQSLNIFMGMAGVYGHINIAQEFIKLGADVDTKDTWGNSYMLMSVIRKQANLVELLVKSGANPNVENRMGVPVLILAVMEGDLETIKVLVESPKILIDAKDNLGQTALMHASHKNFTQIVDILLTGGADPDMKTYFGITALDIAIDKRHYEVEKLINEYKRIKDEKISSEKRAKDRKLLLEKSKENLEAESYLHKEKLDQARDVSALYSGLKKVGIGGISLVLSYFAFKKGDTNMKFYAAGASIISAGLIALSFHDFSNWLNPRHTEKYEELLLKIKKIDQDLAKLEK